MDFVHSCVWQRFVKNNRWDDENCVLSTADTAWIQWLAPASRRHGVDLMRDVSYDKLNTARHSIDNAPAASVGSISSVVSGQWSVVTIRRNAPERRSPRLCFLRDGPQVVIYEPHHLLNATFTIVYDCGLHSRRGVEIVECACVWEHRAGCQWKSLLRANDERGDDVETRWPRVQTALRPLTPGGDTPRPHPTVLHNNNNN